MPTGETFFSILIPSIPPNCWGMTKIITKFFSSHEVFGKHADMLQKKISKQIQLDQGDLQNFN